MARAGDFPSPLNSDMTHRLNGVLSSSAYIEMHGHDRSRPGRGRRKCFLVCRQVEKAIHRN